jgi:hypothetical protein
MQDIIAIEDAGVLEGVSESPQNTIKLTPYMTTY